jgi:outer membrane protein insertion porin family
LKKLFNKYSTLFLFLICWIGTSFCQQSQLEKILQISVSGNNTSESSVIKLSSGLKEGMEASWEDIQQAIKQLWALGIFSDIRIVLDQRTPDGVFLAIKVEEYPRMEKLIIEGNKKLKKEEIDKEIGFFRGQVISKNQIAEAKKRLLKIYAEKGYTLAIIDDVTMESEKRGRVILKIIINEGKKVQIKAISFFNNVIFDDRKLRKQMKETKEYRWWRGAEFDKEKYDEDKEKVIAYYRNHGYRDAEILQDSVYYDNEKKSMYIDIWINEGKCYYIGNITWEGNTIFKEKHLESLLEFSTNDPFSQEKFDKSIHEKVGGAYYDLGYIYTQINPKESLCGEDTLDIHFIIEEGKPVRIRKIIVTGNTRTKERVIRREIRIRPGDVFSRELLMRSARDLMMLNYFSNVIPDAVQFDIEQREQMDLSFKVEEKSTDTANMSAGWSELDRLIGSVGLGMNNLFGNGQRLSLDWNFGRYYRSFNLSFTEPWFLNMPTLIGMSVYDIKRDAYYIGYSQRSQGFSLRFGRRFSWPDNYFRGDWIYRLDNTELGDFSQYISEQVTSEDWPLTSSGITQIISRNSLDQPEFPTRGSQVSLSTEIAGGPFGGNVGYHKHIFSAEYFFSTFFSKLILLSRIQVGFMDVLSKSGRIPYLEYFFIGGSGLSRATPLRGYDDPLAGGAYRNDGGRTMIKTTFELRFPIISQPTMYGLLFAEAGNTWLDIVSTDPFNLRRSIGVGARLFMPMVGMIGFDYAYGFDQLDVQGRRYGAWKPHFVFGRSF